MFYWQDSDPGYYRPAPPAAAAQAQEPAGLHAKTEAAIKETSAKPQGPLIIASRSSSRRSAFTTPTDLFAESPVSTGMKGHSTPMGVFSVIQKHKIPPLQHL